MDLAHFPDGEFRHLQVWNRSVRLENHLFPGQGNLLDLLAVATQAEVERTSDRRASRSA
jgi:hypothetical protein